jgi:hypothetical protein
MMVVSIGKVGIEKNNKNGHYFSPHWPLKAWCPNITFSLFIVVDVLAIMIGGIKGRLIFG